MSSIELTRGTPAVAWSDDTRRAQMLLAALGLFHIVLVGVRLRFGPFPIEFFFLATLLIIAPTLQQLAGDRPIDATVMLIIALIVLRVLATGADLIRYGDHLEERLYFSVHRIAPLLTFLWIYLWRHELVAGGGVETVKKLVIAGLLLHGLATIGAALSDAIAGLVASVGNFLDAPSERSAGTVNSLQRGALTDQIVFRVAGLLKTAPLNAGFIGTLGAVALFLFYRERRHIFLALALLALSACVLTFSRGGLAAMLLAMLIGLLLMLLNGRVGQAGLATLGLGGLAAIGFIVLANFAGGAFLEVALQRFSQFLEPARFESAQTKIAGTKTFFRIVFNDYLVVFYQGEGLNNFLLRARGQLAFDPIDTAFVSNGWLLFAIDNGIYYLLLTCVLVGRLFAAALRHSPGLLIVLLPLSFAVASDNYYAMSFEMHAFFWVVLGVVVLFIEREEQSASTGSRDR